MLSVFGNTFDESDLDAMRQVMTTHLVGMGSITTKFEDTFKQKIGFPFGIATNSCTNSFWLLAKALDFSSQDEIIIPNIHFFGIKNILDLFQVNSVISDVETEVPNISLKYIKNSITSKTKAIIFLEYGGYPLNILEIRDYLKKIKREDILLILDAANSPFTKIGGKYSALDYDLAVYSFDLNKILVTGDGGIILLKDESLARKLKSLSYYGIEDLHKTGFNKSKEKEIWWEVDISSPSLKLAMNNLTASLGISQLNKIDSFLNQRKIVISSYIEEFSKFKEFLDIPLQSDLVENNLYLFWIKVKDTTIRNKLAKFLLDKEIYSTVKYQPLNKNSNTPNAFEFYNNSLCLPFNQNLTISNVEHVISSIKEFFDA